MKLTNISLAILVAIGLVACGGSDDKNNQTTDNNNAGNHNTGNNNPPPPPPKDESGLDPNRVAPDLTVPKDLQTDVNVSKAAYLTRGFADPALGYFSNGGRGYDAGKGTKPADIKFTSTYNYLDEGDVVDSRSPNFKPVNAGAIYVGQYPEKGANINAYVKIKDKYYRVRADLTTSGNNYTPETKFILVSPFDDSLDPDPSVEYIKKLYEDGNYAITGKTVDENKDKTKFDQSDVVFIANVDFPEFVATNKTKINESLVIELGKEGNFAQKTGQTVLQNVSFLGNEYNPMVTGQSLDFSKLPVNKEEIQFTDVTSKYTIQNDKNDAVNNDFSVQRDIELGKVKAYNLPYSIAYVTVDPTKKSEKNIFDLAEGKEVTLADNSTKIRKGSLTNASYQVRGYQTLSLPKQGRAHYTGKSFNATVEGDIKLTADFFEDRAGVHGFVTNRKDVVKDKALPNLKLGRLQLTDPGKHGTFAQTNYGDNKDKGAVEGDPQVTGWSVQFYGLEAQEAGGKLYGSSHEEVYTTQRGRLTNLSNTSDVK